MQPAQEIALYHFREEIRLLFLRRTKICLWLGVVFFSLFSLLDFLCCREVYLEFLGNRLIVVAFVLLALSLLRFKRVCRYTPLLIYALLLIGTLSISLMCVKLGGFTSGYYVGILLMLAGSISVLPLRASQAMFIGVSMYLVYLTTLLLAPLGLDPQQSVFGITNSFFFLAIIATTAVQSMDDLQVQLKSLSSQKNIRDIHHDLVNYTDNLEQLIEKRMAEQTTSELKFRDLYNNLLDLAVLIDRDGVIKMINQHSMSIIGLSPEELIGSNIREFLRSEDIEVDVLGEIAYGIDKGQDLQSMQLQIRKTDNILIDVEISGNRVVVEENYTFFQLIFRDISITKNMERQILESERLIDTSRQTAIFGLAKLAECRDDETGAHLDRIRKYTNILTKELKNSDSLANVITRSFTEDIFCSSILHDIGKVGIPDSILLKPGKLTEDEYRIMKNHCIYGCNTLKEAELGPEKISFLQMGQDIAHYHHERWDGSGYPDGLSGNDIPLPARIVALADVYDALTTSRVYKQAFSHELSKEIIERERGKQFDPFIVDAFLNSEKEFKDAWENKQLH